MGMGLQSTISDLLNRVDGLQTAWSKSRDGLESQEVFCW